MAGFDPETGTYLLVLDGSLLDKETVARHVEQLTDRVRFGPGTESVLAMGRELKPLVADTGTVRSTDQERTGVVNVARNIQQFRNDVVRDGVQSVFLFGNGIVLVLVIVTAGLGDRDGIGDWCRTGERNGGVLIDELTNSRGRRGHRTGVHGKGIGVEARAVQETGLLGDPGKVRITVLGRERAEKVVLNVAKTGTELAQGLLVELVGGLLVVLGDGLAVDLLVGAVLGLLAGMLVDVAVGLITGLVAGVVVGLTAVLVHERVVGLGTGLLLVLLAGLGGGLLAGLLLGLLAGLVAGSGVVLGVGLGSGTGAGLVGFLCGTSTRSAAGTGSRSGAVLLVGGDSGSHCEPEGDRDGDWLGDWYQTRDRPEEITEAEPSKLRPEWLEIRLDYVFDSGLNTAAYLFARWSEMKRRRRRSDRDILL